VKEANFFSHSCPSSAAIRRFTNGQPIGGASDCSFINSDAYSGGSASGMFASNCATFISGPFSPPSAEANDAALFARSPRIPKNLWLAIFAATPPTFAPTRA
jgi:hypothetical protein